VQFIHETAFMSPVNNFLRKCKMNRSLIGILSGLVALSGCTNLPYTTVVTTTTTSVVATNPEVAVAVEQQPVVSRSAKISVVGYGALTTHEKYNEGQRRLMAMRASKLDAYRALAEQVYGVRLTGGSTVGAMVATNDDFRVAIDSYIRGARVSNITQAADGTFETTVEMDFEDSIVNGSIIHPRALVVPSPVHSTTTVAPFYGSTYRGRAAVGPGAWYGSDFYYVR